MDIIHIKKIIFVPKKPLSVDTLNGLKIETLDPKDTNVRSNIVYHLREQLASSCSIFLTTDWLLFLYHFLMRKGKEQDR